MFHLTTDFIAIQTGNYLIAITLLIYAWRNDRQLAWLMISGVLMGYAIEASQTTQHPPLYHYTQALIFLPGQVPLGIVLSWASIFFALFNTLKMLKAPYWLAPFIGGLIAVGLDLITDPAFVSLGFWVWENPVGWFGIPWFNYMGWFLIVASFIWGSNLAKTHIKPQNHSITWQLIRAFLPIVFTFCIFVPIMLVYMWAFAQHHFLPQQLVVGVFFTLVGLLVLKNIPLLKRDAAINYWTLLIPTYLILVSLLILFFSNLHNTHPELTIIIPVISTLILIFFLWPNLNLLLGIKSTEDLTVHSKKSKQATLLAFISTTLLILVIWQSYIAPKNSLIGPIELPADDAFLPNQEVQWWYWTGHLKTEQGREFGFETVFFTFDSFFIMRDQLIQTAVTDVQDNSFHFNEFIEFYLPKKLDKKFNLNAGDNNQVSAIGGGGKDKIHFEVDNYVVDLKMEEVKKPALHYGGDAHPYVFGGFTYYYSRVHMKTSGTIKIDDEIFEVSGTTWFDRQYGDLYQAIVQGWQWFAIELDDNRQIMLYDILGKTAEVEKSGSITDAQGNTRLLSRHEFSVKTLGKWKSPHTGCTYPSGWEVTVDEMKLTIMPQVKDQELRVKHHFWAGPEYWEGTNTVSGDVNGRAYVELNGFCRGIEGSYQLN
ncbi:MAG: carotenoid biosynthesis protein [Gammaproteobacteria bacterium]|nr:carotenoid biosynthesis protein [Gammaproteobacteria bacterium]